jgi:hypothetical protein
MPINSTTGINGNHFPYSGDNFNHHDFIDLWQVPFDLSNFLGASINYLHRAQNTDFNLDPNNPSPPATYSSLVPLDATNVNSEGLQISLSTDLQEQPIQNQQTPTAHWPNNPTGCLTPPSSSDRSSVGGNIISIL